MKNFINGTTSYLETFFEIVSAISIESENDKFESKVVEDRHTAQGHGGMYELAEELTDEFEKLHENEDWSEKDFFDTIDAFIKEKLF